MVKINGHKCPPLTRPPAFVGNQPRGASPQCGLAPPIKYVYLMLTNMLIYDNLYL